MSYTEHDETMDSRSLDGITASGAAESSPVGVSQEAPGVERADPAGDRTEGIAPVLEAGTEEEATAPAAQAEGGGLDPPEAPLPSGESEQTGEAGPETPVEEKPKRKRVSRKKAADSPEDTSGGEAAGEAAQASEEEDTSSGASDDLSAQGGDTPEHDDDEDLETDAFVLSDGGEEMPPTPLEGTGDDDTADAPMEGPEPAPSPKARPARRTASAAKTANRPKKEFTSRPLKDKPTLLSLDLNKLDEDLSEEERNEWNAIYASYRSKSILTGRIMGIDTHSFTVRNRETRQTERRKMLCAVIINYRVKVLISGNRSVVPRPGAAALCTSQHERRGDRLYHPGCRPRGRCGHWLTPNGAGRPEALFRYHQRRAEHWREADLPRSGCGPQAVPGGVWRQGYEPKPEGPHLHRYT